MWNLTDANDSLEVVLGGVATTQSRVVSSYTDVLYDVGTGFSTDSRADKQIAVTNNTTPVTIVSAPPANTRRSVKRISITNLDAADITVTFNYNDNTVLSRLFNATIAPGERVAFSDINGWSVYDVFGAVKVTAVQNVVDPGFISGLGMLWNSANSLTAVNGVAYIPSEGKNVSVQANLTLSALVLSTNTWYHLYLFLSGGVPAIELVTTAPSAPYNGTARTKSGDNTRRYLGSVRTIAANTIAKFDQTGTFIKYYENLNVTPFAVVAGGTATVATSVSCADAVPVTSKDTFLLANNNATGQTIYMSNTNAVNPLSTLQWLGFLGPLQTLPRGTFPLNSSQAFQYMYDAAPAGQFFARVVGYVYER